MKIQILLPMFLLLSMTFAAGDLHAISPTVKAYQDYGLTMKKLREIRIMVENFGDDALKQKFAELKKQFQDAGENYYGQNFIDSASKFKKLKMELISMLATIDDIYLKRTKEILDSTSKESFDTLIEYSKTSGLASYFRRPYDPLKDIKPYDTDKYHLFHDREKIESYLREGYKKYHTATKIYEDPEIAIMRDKKTLTRQNINFIIHNFTRVITLCREAKEAGIEIHRVRNINKLGESMIKYNVSHGNIIPIYDDRIPEQFKVDANDNMMLIHSVEMRKLGKKRAGTGEG
ncbi:MAG: hypothetical protein JXA07_00705 [Spirochaetes bacterium]|nr:hypothetical protein [Spirochaetota bacterium]